MSVRRTSESLESSAGWKACTNHQDRVATHQLMNHSGHSEVFYCQKCSIMLASQGYSVMKLNPVTRRNPSLTRNQKPKKNTFKVSTRKTEIQNFMGTLDETIMMLQEKNQTLQEHLMKSQTEYGQAIEAVNAFYRQIEEVIQLQKYTTYNTILNKRATEQAEIRCIKEGVLDYIEEISSMMDDIKENMDAVETVDYPIYSEIMKGYKLKLDSIAEVRDAGFKFKPISKCEVNFPEIPKTLYSIADKINISSHKYSGGTFNSLNILQPERVVAEEEENQESSCCSQSRGRDRQSYYLKENCLDKSNYFKQPDHILKSMGQGNDLAFSFDESEQISKQLVPTYQNSQQPTMKSRYAQNSKASQEMESQNVLESRGSLGAYLNLSESRDRNSIEDTETLLIM